MSVETLQGLKRKATLSIKKDDVKASVKTELKKYAKDAKIQGFRPGKVPANIVEQMYGGRAYEDSLNTHLNKKFTELLDTNKLEIVDYPKFDLTSDEGDFFVFAATFEIMPEIKLGDLTTIEINKPDCEFSDADVANTIDVLRKQRGSYITDTAKNATSGDKVTIDFVGTIDNVEFDGGKAENYQFILGQNMMLPEFEAGIIGLKVGDTNSIEVNFPNDYQAEKLRGKRAIFNITLKNLEIVKLAELNETFIKSIGISQGTEDALIAEVKNNMKREVKRRLQIKIRENALNGLSKVSPIEVPSKLVHDEIHYMIDKTTENMKKNGYQPKEIKLTHEMFENDAKRMVLLRLLVQEFIKQNQIKINEDEVKVVVMDMASVYEDPAQYLKWYYSDKSRLDNAYAVAMENKVVEQILNKSKIKNISMSYEDLMRESI